MAEIEVTPEEELEERHQNFKALRMGTLGSCYIPGNADTDWERKEIFFLAITPINSEQWRIIELDWLNRQRLVIWQEIYDGSILDLNRITNLTLLVK